MATMGGSMDESPDQAPVVHPGASDFLTAPPNEFITEKDVADSGMAIEV